MAISKRNPIETVVAIGIGSALFTILGRFGSIPTWIPDTNVETTYALLALFAVLYGPLAGVLIGFIGHTLKDLTYGTPWFSWIIASAAVGLIIGLASGKVRAAIDDGDFSFKTIIRFNFYQIAANAVAWFVIAPSLDILIYAEPANKVYTQGLVAGASNIVTVAILGTLLLAAYGRTRVKKGSLTREA